MNVYIDKENLVSLYQKKKTSEIISDGIRLIKKHCSIYFNFPQIEAQEEPISFIVKDFTAGVGQGTKQVFIKNVIPERPLKSNFHTSIDDKQSIFLINGDIEKGKSANSLFVVNLGEEEALFDKLMLYNREYKTAKDVEIGAVGFEKWEDLGKYAFPFTDIIIFDKYLFSDNSLTPYNFEKILSVLHEGKNFKTNILIVTNPKYKDNSGAYDIISETKSCIEKVIGKKPNVTLINTYRAEHDRTIFTNYLRFKSGDSFNYFNSTDRKITNGRELDLKSLIDSDYFSLANSLLADLQAIIIDLENNNPDAIQGDKKSNFLNFKT